MTGSASAAVELRRGVGRAADDRPRGPAIRRASAAGRSSCPTCTPTAPARRATSTRSLTTQRRAGGAAPPARSAGTSRGTRRSPGRLARTCRCLTPARRNAGATPTRASGPPRSAHVDVDDRVEAATCRRPAQADSADAATGFAGGMKRSMKWVLIRPATKSGSLRIFRCSGMRGLDAFDDRHARASASCGRSTSARSRPWTMTLAIIES